jgi:hypothetical protein
MDSRICQTSTATPAEPGGLPFRLERNSIRRRVETRAQVALAYGPNQLKSRSIVRRNQSGNQLL